jgi:hypothetical protein
MFLNKNKSLFFVFQVILFLLVAYFFYIQLSKISINSINQVKIKFPFLFLYAIILIFFNWFFEYLKWNLILNFINTETPNSIKIKSFFAGIFAGFVTPNLLGNFIGRMFYFKRMYRSTIILFSLLANASQFLSSMLFGCISLLILKFPFVDFQEYRFFIQILFSIFLLIILFYYFNFEKKYPNYFNKKKWFILFVNRIKKINYLRLKFLIYSLLRHFVFSFQYVLILCSFGIDFSFEIVLLVWNVYFWTTLIPSVWFGKILIRESVAIWLFTTYSYSGEIVILSSILLWLMNQGLTALISIPFVKFKQHV